MSGIPEEMNVEAEYETKTVQWHNSPSQFALMLTVFKPEGNKALGEEGYGSGNMMIAKLAGGTVEAHYDPYKMDLSTGEENITTFLRQVKTGYFSDGDNGIPWDDIEDGETITPHKAERLAD